MSARNDNDAPATRPDAAAHDAAGHGAGANSGGDSGDAAFLAACAAVVGSANLIVGDDMARYLTDWRGRFTGKARAVRFSTLEAICEALQCQPGDLLTFAATSEDREVA